MLTATKSRGNGLREQHSARPEQSKEVQSGKGELLTHASQKFYLVVMLVQATSVDKLVENLQANHRRSNYEIKQKSTFECFLICSVLIESVH